MEQCRTCKAVWTDGAWTPGCRECGGGAMDRPCRECGGRCGRRQKKAPMDSNDFHDGHWSGSCGLKSVRHLMREALQRPEGPDGVWHLHFLEVLSLPETDARRQRRGAWSLAHPQPGARLFLPLQPGQPLGVHAVPCGPAVFLPALVAGREEACRFVLDGGRPVLENVRLQPAPKVNGAPAAGRARLGPGDVLELGAEPFVLRFEVETIASEADRLAALESLWTP